MLRICHLEKLGSATGVCLYTTDGMPLTDDPFFNTCEKTFCKHIWAFEKRSYYLVYMFIRIFRKWDYSAVQIQIHCDCIYVSTEKNKKLCLFLACAALLHIVVFEGARCTQFPVYCAHEGKTSNTAYPCFMLINIIIVIIYTFILRVFERQAHWKWSCGLCHIHTKGKPGICSSSTKARLWWNLWRGCCSMPHHAQSTS